jgi:hypothetical protein
MKKLPDDAFMSGVLQPYRLFRGIEAVSNVERLNSNGGEQDE